MCKLQHCWNTLKWKWSRMMITVNCGVNILLRVKSKWLFNVSLWLSSCYYSLLWPTLLSLFSLITYLVLDCSEYLMSCFLWRCEVILHLRLTSSRKCPHTPNSLTLSDWLCLGSLWGFFWRLDLVHWSLWCSGETYVLLALGVLKQRVFVGVYVLGVVWWL